MYAEEGPLPCYQSTTTYGTGEPFNHMGWWENKIYQYMPVETMYWCDSFAVGDAWDLWWGYPGAQNQFLVDNMPSGYGLPMKVAFNPSSTLNEQGRTKLHNHHGVDLRTNLLSSAGAAIGDVYLYFHREPGWCGGTSAYPNTLWPGYFGGYHGLSRGETVYSEWQARAFIVGQDTVMFGDGHVELMSWMEKRCHAQRQGFGNPSDAQPRGWTLYGSWGSASEDDSRGVIGQGLDYWSSCIEARGQQEPEGW